MDNIHSQPCTVRPAVSQDIPAILAVLAPAAEAQQILPRTEHEVAAAINGFLVAVADDTQQVCGCVAIKDFGDGLFEVRSLVVLETFRGNGIGGKLVLQALQEAHGRGADRVFALTYRPRLFERFGFVRVEKSRFPQKVWTDCAKCKHRDACDETALIHRFTNN